MAIFPSDNPDQGLLTPEEIQLLKRVQRSKVWRLIMDALCLEREELFSGNSSISGLSGHPSTTEQLWQHRGAILLIQHLLQAGPQFVIWYQRHMEAKEIDRVQRRASKDAQPEREYTPGGATDGLHDPPDFDL